jgi:photosystem II stability/assembly factor-like uncharacterized protein
MKLRAAFIVMALAAAVTATAAPIAPADYGMLHWRSIGPFRGGRVLAVSGASDDRLHFYFGSVNGGVWETRDAGRTWNPIFDAVGVGSIGALAVAPSDPKTLYVGTGESDMRSDIAQGAGMFRSRDGGKTWTAIGLKDSQQIARILVDPRDPRRVLVAALGHPYGPNAERGVFLSTNGGETWTKTLFKDADTGAIDLTFKPGDPSVVYAGLWQTRRPPWNVYPPSSGPGGGLYKSTDGGATWAPVTAGLPPATGRIGIAVSPAAPARVYVLIDAKVGGGLYRSDDDGATFTQTSKDERIWQRGWYFGELTVNPANPDQLWVCDTIVLRSDDEGHTFLPVKGDPTGDDFHHLWIDPADPARRILGSDQGAQVTLNGGATWSSWFNQPTGQFYHVAVDNAFPYRVYGAQQDSGAADVPSRGGSVWDGVNMTQFHESEAGGESDNIAPDPDDPKIVYGGRVDRLDRHTEQVRSVDPTLAVPGEYRETWTLPLVFGPDRKSLYFANQRIWRTVDGGNHWDAISPDLTRPDPGVPATLDAPTAADVPRPGLRKGVVYAIGPSPRDARDIWAGTDDGLVWRTRDGGGHWTEVTPKGLAPWSKIGVVEASHFDADTAYIAVDRHRLDDRAPYVMRTTDGGRSWTSIVTGLDSTVNVVREDPVRRGLLFAGTERGAFVSFDDGKAWSPLQAGLPTTSVRDIVVKGDDLVIATHGRGFYVMDDIAGLRELAADGSNATRLFAPAAAVRFRPSGFAGTPMPKDEPMSIDPAFGAAIDYSLATDGPVTIRIEDAAGAPVRTFSSADPDPAPDLAKIDSAPEWLPRSPPPASTAGAHRFVWDLRYALSPGVAPNPQLGAVWAPPGRYSVVLIAGGETLRQPLTVAPDPRVTAAPASYQAEFDLARRIEADRGRVAAALKANPDDVELKTLAERLAKLQLAVDGADGGPSADAVAGYALASAAVKAKLGG